MGSAWGCWLRAPTVGRHGPGHPWIFLAVKDPAPYGSRISHVFIFFFFFAATVVVYKSVTQYVREL